MVKDSCITVTLTGGVITATDKTAPKKQEAQAKDRKKPREKSGGKAYAERNKGSISRAVQRSKVSYAQKVGQIKNRPTYHIALIMPERHAPEYEALIVNHCLSAFFKELIRRYKHCYLVRLFDWSQDAGLHAHILVRFGPRFGEKSSRRQKERDVREIWSGIVHSHASKLVKVTEYCKRATIGYLTSTDKDRGLRVVLQRLNGGRIWSIVNSKNIRWHEKTIVCMTTAEHEVFKRILRQLFADEGLHKSNAEQLKKGSYCLNYLTPELTARAYKKFLKWREAQ